MVRKMGSISKGTKKAKKTIKVDEEEDLEARLLSGDTKAWKRYMMTIVPPKWPPGVLPKNCVQNANVSIYNSRRPRGNEIPFMSLYAACYLSTHGYQMSDQFRGIDVMAAFETLTGQDTSLSIPEKQAILNGLRVGKEYAEGMTCINCCELQKLLHLFPCVSITGAKLLLRAFGTADNVVSKVTITSNEIYGRDVAWMIFDEVFCRVDLSYYEACQLFETLMFIVHFKNWLVKTDIPGGSGTRQP